MPVLDRTPLLLERARPSMTNTPKTRTRRISTTLQLGPTRRSLYARMERRVRDRATPQSREVLRGLAKIRHRRRESENSALKTSQRAKSLLGLQPIRSLLMKGRRL